MVFHIERNNIWHCVDTDLSCLDQNSVWMNEIEMMKEQSCKPFYATNYNVNKSWYIAKYAQQVILDFYLHFITSHIKIYGSELYSHEPSIRDHWHSYLTSKSFFCSHCALFVINYNNNLILNHNFFRHQITYKTTFFKTNI